jgi:threonine-phosphate decarboxylase
MNILNFPHGGNIYAVKRIFKKEVIDFSANINPLGLPPRIKKIIYKNFESVLHYPDPEAKDITRKISRLWGIKEENVLLGNGSVELIYLIASCFMPKITSILVPTFSEYERAARNIKSRIRFVNLYEKENFRLDPNRLSNSDILFFSNPNNPTGNLIFTDSRMIEKLSHKLVVVDEAFMDFLPNEETHSLIRKAQNSQRIIVLRTFTKFFALPGLRIGYLVAHKDIVKALKKYRIPWSVNALALKAAECLLVDKSYINKTKQFIEKERSFLFKEITKIKNLKPYPSVANFLLIKIEDKNLSSTFLTKKLIQRGILIRDCANFRGLNHKFIRVAVRSHNENLKLVEALKEAI